MSIFQNCLCYPRFCKTNIAWYGRKILRTYSFRSAYFLPYSSKLFSSSSNMFINMHSKSFFKKQQLFFWSRKYAFSYRKSKSFTSVRYIASEIIKESSIPKTSEVMRIFRLAAPEKKKLMVGIGLLLISSGITMAVPYCLGRIIDIIYTSPAENMMETLTSFCQVLVVVFLLGSVANFGRVHIMQTSGQRIIQKMRKGVFSSIMNQEIEFFDKNKTGELINRLSADTSLVGQALTNNLSDGLRSLSAVVAGVSMMFYVSPKLALFALGIVPPFAVFAVVCGRYVKSISRNIQDTLASSTQIAEERISNIRTVRAFAQENKEMQVYEKKVKDVLLLTYKEAIIKGFFFGAAGLCGNLIVLSVLYYGGVMMTNSQITVGDLSSFLMYAAYVGISVGGLTSVYSEIMRGMGASTRLWQLIDRIPKIPLTDGVTPSSEIRGIIEFRDVCFSYPTRKDAFIFNSLNLVVPAASVMAVVGASGSGKSTLAALLLRFYNPDAGKILLDGYDITNLNPAWLRHNIGTVSQEPILFSCSIAENIVYGASDSSTIRTQHLIDVAKKANAFNFIDSFPDKFNTLVGERGIMLSGGQKQRIAIARALLKNPKILLLDEATSALDAESEFLVQEALERLMEGRTVLTIAHRLSTIKNADQIAVLHNGKFAELGSYEELMKLPNGLFKKLVERQTIITQ